VTRRTSPEPLLAARVEGMRPSRLRELVAEYAPGSVLSLAGGLPPPEAFPAEAIAEAADRLLSRPDVAALQYPPAEGDRGLIQAIAADLQQRLGLDARADRLVLTTGSQQAFDLLAKVTLDPGDPVVVECPTYVGALRALAVYQPTFVNVPVDRDGIDTAHLEGLLSGGLRPKLCYVVPNFSNPSGATLTAERRLHLADLAGRYGFLVVEDDPYGQLRFTGAPVAPVAAHAPPSQVAYVGSFSKVIAPGLRVGYVLVPDGLHRPVVLVKQAADLASSSFTQRLVAELLAREGWLDDHVAGLRKLYRERADALAGAVARRLLGRLSFDPPAGGMFAWASLAGGVSAADLTVAAAARGVAVVPGEEFVAGGEPVPAVRLSFSMLGPADIDRAVERIALAFDDLSQDQGRR
jgi:2-aminoadipate transaminase